MNVTHPRPRPRRREYDELLAYTRRRDRVLVVAILVVLAAAVTAFVVMTMRDNAHAEWCEREEYAAAYSGQEVAEECT